MSEHPEADDTTIAGKARAYCAARQELAGADKGGILPALTQVDIAWHELHQACGYPCDDD